MEKISQKNGTPHAQSANTRVPHLEKLLKLDACFRNPSPQKCTLAAIQNAFKIDPNFTDPLSKSTFHNYLGLFRNIYGAEFKGRVNDTLSHSKKSYNGKKGKNKNYTFVHARIDGCAYYQYKDIDAPLPGLQEFIGKVRQDSGKELIKALEIEQRGCMATPWYILLRLFLDRINKEQSTSLNVVSFYENIDLDIQIIHKFERLLKAILDKQSLKLHYVTKTGMHTDAMVLPYRLKNYNQRWYLIAKCYNPNPNERHPDEFYEGYSNYPLDGIVDLLDRDGHTILIPAIQNWDYEYIKPDDVDLDEYFNDMVGITASKTGPEDVYLRFTPERYAYVESKPIVGSQKKPVSEGHEYYREGHVTIKLRVHINRELEQLILSYGPDCEVVAPDTLRNKIHDKISAMAALYGE